MNIVSQVRVQYIDNNGVSHYAIAKDNKMIKCIQYIYGGKGILEHTISSGVKTKKDALSIGRKYLDQKRNELHGKPA